MTSGLEKFKSPIAICASWISYANLLLTLLVMKVLAILYFILLHLCAQTTSRSDFTNDQGIMSNNPLNGWFENI